MKKGVFLWFLLVLFFIFRLSFYFIFPHSFINKPRSMVLTGRVNQIKKITPRYIRFIFKTKTGLVYLHWYHWRYQIQVGEKYKLYCQLKPPRGLHNDVGFDFRQWLLSQDIVASGYVVNGRAKLLERVRLKGVAQFRQVINHFIETHIFTHAALLMALTTGSRELMSPSDWQVLQETGTTHLFAISGLHLGVVALFFAFWVRLMWRIFPFLGLSFPSNKAAVLVSGVLMIPYTFFVGCSVSVVRALWMLLIFSFFFLQDQRLSFWERFFCAFFLVMLLQPWVVYSASFYLSFAAVYFIGLLFQGDLVSNSVWRKWFKMQLGLFFGLLSLSLFFFSKVSLVSPLANMVAIPWMTLFIVPCCLLASLAFLFSKTLALFLFKVAAGMLSLLWKYLQCLIL